MSLDFQPSEITVDLGEVINSSTGKMQLKFSLRNNGHASIYVLTCDSKLKKQNQIILDEMNFVRLKEAIQQAEQLIDKFFKEKKLVQLLEY